MRRLLLPLILSTSAAAGCATAGGASSDGLAELRRAQASAAEQRTQVERLRARNRALTTRERRLEAELALARADARELRGELEMRRQTHHIGGDSGSEEGWVEVDGLAATAQADARSVSDPGATDDVDSEVADRAPEDEGPRPVLRLYGTPEEPAPITTVTTAPTARVGRAATLAPVPPMPDVGRLAATPRAAPSDAALAEYRQALQLVRDRQFERALPALERFVAAHPEHPYADNALYWRGEVFFLRRQYPQALAEYTRLLSGYPRGNKAADALLRSGLCHLRMGDASRARASFRRLRESFPNSVAARRASREDAS